MIKIELHPLLEAVLQPNGMEGKSLEVALKSVNGRWTMAERGEVWIAEGEKFVVWPVPSLRNLLRGEKAPPSMAGEPPPEYLPYFKFIESHVVRFCTALGEKTDGDFEEAYSNLRRRPDGKPFSQLHGFMWQVAALLIGLYPLSPAEFEAIYSRLTLSASTFRMGHVSRNYIDTLRRTGLLYI